jgi:gentisate 1,2-dioxygenase
MAAPVAIPEAYKAELDKLSLRPLWTLPVKGEATAGPPLRRAKPAHWPYRRTRELLLRAGDVVSIEDADRRVLMYINPGFSGPAAISTTATIFVGMQLILPGEYAPKHRHTAGAARFIVEGEGAYTAVNGEKLPMAAGDLVLTPPQHMHEHGHDGNAPMIWMDIVDHPVAVPFDVFYQRSGAKSALGNAPDASETKYSCAGLIPYRAPGKAPAHYPLMRYRWAKVRAALDATAEIAARDEPVHFMYVNPETGASALETYGFSARLLRPGEEISPAKRSASGVVFVIDGEGESDVDGQSFHWERCDVVAIPTFAALRHRNRSASRGAYLLEIDDAPLQHKLGYYEEAPQPGNGRGE